MRCDHRPAPFEVVPMNKVLSLILGGGRGTRLYPLTKLRSKPAVPIGGKYRLIDIPISNCINSDLTRIYVLTQYLSTSLNRHVANTYRFDVFNRGFVEILAAQQAEPVDEDQPAHEVTQGGWYAGTADAVRRNLRHLLEDDYSEVIVLSGDQLYRMDFRRLIKRHRHARADVTIAVLPVPREQVGGLGIVSVDDAGGVIYTRMRNLPPSRVVDAVLRGAIVSDGCLIQPGTRVERSIVGVRSRVGRNVVLRDAVLIGADHYETDVQRAANHLQGIPDL